ncbi:MAG: hypothetical protein U0R44_01295 [Candidatus Micrarchaeia archaeon]
MASKKEGPKILPVGRDRMSTLDFPVSDPQIDRFDFVSARLRLFTLKRYFSAFTLVSSSDPNGFRFESFIRNSSGLKTLTLNGTDFDFVRTGSGIYLVLADPTAASALGSVTGIDMSKKSEVSNGKESLIICRISSSEMARIESISCSPRPTNVGIAPADMRSAVDLPDFRAKIAGCRAIKSEEGFDPSAFSATVVEAGIFNDVQHRLHYAIATADGTSYTLYVNSNPNEHRENPLVFVGRYGLDVCYLYRVEVVG